MAQFTQTIPRTTVQRCDAELGAKINTARSVPAKNFGSARMSTVRRSQVQRLQVSAYDKVTPVGDRVCVKVQKKEDTSAGGILLPETALEKPTSGEVVAVGSVDGVSLGDNVVYSKFAGSDVDVAGEPHMLLKEDDCIGVMGDDVAQMKPFSDRILVKITEAETTTQGGLLLTEASKEKPSTGTVIAVGPGGKSGDKTKPVAVTVGSTVLFNKFSGTEFKGNDKTEYIVVREGDVLAMLE